MNISIEVTPTSDIQHTLPKLRTHFCQLLEELKIRRENDRESDKRVKELVSVQHGLEEKLEEGAFRLHRLQEEQISKLEEQRKMFEDQIKESDEEKMRAQLLSDTSMKEIKSLRDEIRKLHLSKFSLEKIIKDQECKLQLMNSSRDSYHLQISQIETQSSRCSQQLSELETALTLLQNSVNSALSVNEVVRNQNTTYSKQLENMKEESNKLLEKVYKNPLYQEIKFREEREQVEIVKFKVQLNHSKDRIEELENELLSVNTNFSKTQKSLQECHQLIMSQSAANKKLEEEVRRQEGEKLEFDRAREREFDKFKTQIINVEEDRDKLQEEYNQMSIKLDALLNKQNNKEDIIIQNTGQYECIDMETEVQLSPVILCPDSQEAIESSQESNPTHAKIYIEKCRVMTCSQDSKDNDEIIENQDLTLVTYESSYSDVTHIQRPNSPSPEPPNKRTKLETDTYTTPHGSPLISSPDD